MPAPNAITPQQLLRRIGLPDGPHIIDICLSEDFDEDPYLIPGAKRFGHKDVDAIKAHVLNEPTVIVCQKGLKLSQGLVAWLRCDGVNAQYLDGGAYAWRELPDAPRVPVSKVPFNTNGSTVWVTRHRPKIDRIACPWLIRRFVDRSARFLFVSPSEVMNVAERFEAVPFDVENTRFGHRAKGCTFDTMLDEWNLKSPALTRLADVVRAADTDNHDIAPEAAGLLAVSVGLSRQYKDDHAQLEAGMHVYDALYRWARDGFTETHNSIKGRVS